MRLNSIELLKIIDEINECIDKSINISESLGLEVYESVSVFEENMNNLLKTIIRFLDKFFSNDLVNNNSFVEKLSIIRKNLENSLNSLINTVEISEEIFFCLFGDDSDNSPISRIIDKSNEIENILEEMFSAATNSSITATQLGDAGGAYSIISKEIQRESNQLNKHYSNMYEIIEKNFPKLDELREHITRFKDKEKLRNNFTSLINEFVHVEQKLKSFKEEINNTIVINKEKIPELLSHLVNQDIFRQELEHIKEFTNEASKRLKKDSHENNTGFINFVMNISKDIFNSGKEEFLESFSHIENDISDITDSCCVEMKGYLLEFGKYFDDDNRNSLKRLVDEIMIITVQNNLFIEEVLDNLASLRIFLNNFEGKIGILIEHIKITKSIIKRFQTMRILLKAELVRLTDILGKKAKDNEEQFETIINDVNKKTQSVKEVIDELDELYKSNYTKFKIFENISANHVSKDELKHIFDTMKTMVNNMNEEYSKLKNEINKQSKIILASKDNFSSNFSSLKDLTNSNSINFSKILESIPNSFFNYEKDEELKKLIDKMTTYKERVVAQKHLEVEDVGTDGGEFTLF